MRVLFAGVGLTHYFNQVLNRLQRDLGVEIHNLVPEQGRGHAAEGVFQTGEGVEFQVHRLPWLALPFHYRSFRGLAGLLRRIAPRLAVVGADLNPAFTLSPLVRSALARTRCRVLMKSIPFEVPTYAEARAAAHRSPLRRALLELRAASYRLADGHVVYVDEGRELYQGYGVDPGRVFVTRNSPDTDALLAARAAIEGLPPLWPPSGHRLVHVGRLVQWKRVDLLIDALALVRGRFAGAELVVVGDGPELEGLRRRAASAGLEGAVRFLGGIYGARELGRVLLSCSVYVLAGMGGLSINDAMCFGLPVVASVCDGTERKLVREGENGAYFEAGSAESLAAAIGRILEDPARRQAMGERSTAIIRDEVNIRTVVDGYRKAFAFVDGLP